MKNLVKSLVLTVVGVSLFSCTTDEYDAALEQSVKVTENIKNEQFKSGDSVTKDEEANSDMLQREDDGNPLIIIVKKD